MNLVRLPDGIETKVFVIDENALSCVPAVLTEYFPGHRPLIVADENTWRAAGEAVAENLPDRFPDRIFPGTPRLHPDSRYADELAASFPENAVPVAVGSGVINDIVKRASGIRSLPYCCVPTACSVDGYTSYGAAMTVNGFKKTLPCPAPLAIVADTGVLAAAPPEMLASGYADLLTKVPAGADWLIAEAIGIEPRRADVWDLVQKPLRGWIADPDDRNAVFQGLAATGYAMQLYRESRPASGAEHLMSHVWEMEGLSRNGEEVSHGFKVAVGTLAVLRLMAFVMDRDAEEAESLAAPPPDRAEQEKRIDSLLIRGCYGPAASVAREKILEGNALAERRKRIFSVWNDLRVSLREQLLPESEFLRLLRKAGAPVSPAGIGLSREQYLHGVETAQLIRKRYTVLDFLFEAGLLHEAMKGLVY